MATASIVVLDASGKALRQTDDWSADIAYGADEQRFTISRIAGAPLAAHMRWQVDGTALAGVVDTVCPSVAEDGSSSVSYKGRTVQGVLAGKVIMPPSGQTHLTATGDLNECITAIVESCGLSEYLVVPSTASGFEVSGYRYRRFCDAYTGLRMLCASVGARLRFRATGDGIELSAQTLTGVAEVAQTYDYSGSDDLSADTRAKLAELQGQGTFPAALPDDAGLDVGDAVTAYDSTTGIGVEAQVTKVVCKVSLGEAVTGYETGEPQWPEDEE